MSIEDTLAGPYHPSQLDQLAITNGRGMLMGMFGLGAELQVKPRDREQLRLDMLAVQEDYYRLFKHRINRSFIEENPRHDGKFVAFKEEQFALIKRPPPEWPDNTGYTHMLFERYTHPDFPVDANTVTPVMSQFYVQPKKTQELSSYECNMPITSNDGNGVNFALLREALLRWCNILHPAHGTAGLYALIEPNTQTGGKYVYPIMQRFPGLEFHSSTEHSGNCESTYNRIKCINWLTVLDDEILAELGGLDAAKTALTPDCSIHPFDGGIVIQAGDVPQLGDSHKTPPISDAYRSVARFTKPVRFGPHNSSLFRVLPPLDSKEESNKWVARFD